MKKFVLVVLVAVVGLGVLALVNPSMMHRIRQATGAAPAATTVYKWQDKNGAWHVTNERPPEGVAYQKQEDLPDVNVLPALKSGK